MEGCSAPASWPLLSALHNYTKERPFFTSPSQLTLQVLEGGKYSRSQGFLVALGLAMGVSLEKSHTALPICASTSSCAPPQALTMEANDAGSTNKAGHGKQRCSLYPYHSPLLGAFYHHLYLQCQVHFNSRMLDW